MNGMTGISCSPICEQRQNFLIRAEEEEEDGEKEICSSYTRCDPIASGKKYTHNPEICYLQWYPDGYNSVFFHWTLRPLAASVFWDLGSRRILDRTLHENDSWGIVKKGRQGRLISGLSSYISSTTAFSFSCILFSSGPVSICMVYTGWCIMKINLYFEAHV
jgi:hypothetical protein